MRKLAILFVALLCALSFSAQTRQSAQKKKATAAATQKKTATTTAKKRSTSTVKGKTAANKKGATKKSTTKRTTTKRKQKTPVYTNENIKGLQNQRAAIQKKIKEQQRLLNANKADVKKRLSDLLVINSEITTRKKTIDTIQSDIRHIDGNIELLKTQLNTLEEQLKDRKAKYVRSMRYMARHRNIQDQLMFIFSADNLSQMYRRMRFVREYASYQKAQGELVKAKQQQIDEKQKQLKKVRGQKNTLLNKGKKEQAELEGQQNEQQKMVNTLQKQQKTIQAVIDDQKKKDAELNAEIDRLVAIEVAKAKARAEAEAKRKAAEAAAAKKKREEELARKKAAAEAAARENARRIEEARKEEARLKAAAREVSKADAAAKERAEQLAREAEANRKAAERKAEVDRSRHEKEISEAKKQSNDEVMFSSADRKLSGGFENNKGRLPIPITGKYRIVSHYGQYHVEGLRNITLDNKGVNIQGQAGAQARAVFDGEVSAVFSFGGMMVVMVRHGRYISVYCNLRSCNVSKGQHVSARQSLGAVGAGNVLQFQLRRGTDKLNPEAWLGR